MVWARVRSDGRSGLPWPHCGYRSVEHRAEQSVPSRVGLHRGGGTDRRHEGMSSRPPAVQLVEQSGAEVGAAAADCGGPPSRPCLVAPEVSPRWAALECWPQHCEHDCWCRTCPCPGTAGELTSETQQLRSRPVADGVVHQLRKGGQEGVGASGRVGKLKSRDLRDVLHEAGPVIGAEVPACPEVRELLGMRTHNVLLSASASATRESPGGVAGRRWLRSRRLRGWWRPSGDDVARDSPPHGGQPSRCVRIGRRGGGVGESGTAWRRRSRHDAANAIATSVSTHAPTRRVAKSPGGRQFTM